MRFGTTIAMSLALVATAASAGYRDTLDDDGCWDGRDRYGDDCVKGTSEWNERRFTLILTNTCPQRLYLRYCNERENSSSADCGAWGLRGYGEKRWSTSRGATGRARWKTVGSTISSKDWVCGSKVSGWNDRMVF